MISTITRRKLNVTSFVVVYLHPNCLTCEAPLTTDEQRELGFCKQCERELEASLDVGVKPGPKPEAKRSQRRRVQSRLRDEAAQARIDRIVARNEKSAGAGYDVVGHVPGRLRFGNSHKVG